MTRWNDDELHLQDGLRDGGPWRPEWAADVPPGDTLAELLDMRSWTQAHLARETGFSLKHVNQVVNGSATISTDLALALERVGCGTAEFWVCREGQYRVALARRALLAGDGAE